MKLTIGRIVHVRLHEQWTEAITRRRTTSGSILDRMQKTPPEWPTGAQAHIGNPVSAGQVFPAIVVAAHSDVCANLQILLDGCDVFWATSVLQGTENGTWFWPPRE